MIPDKNIEIETIKINVDAVAADLFKQLRESDSISPLILSLPTETVERYIKAAIEIGIELEKVRAIAQQKEFDRLQKEN